MQLNPPNRVRAVVYIVTAVLSPVMAYLLAKGYIGQLEMSLWAAEVSVATGLAALNTDVKGN